MDRPELSDEVLLRMAEGGFSPDEERAIREKLAASPQWAGRFAELSTLVGSLRELQTGASLFEVSRDRIVKIQNIVQSGQSHPVGSAWNRAAELVATLVFDSFRTAVPGLRSGTVSARLLHLACEGTRITIRTERDGVTGAHSVCGEVEPSRSYQKLQVQDSTGAGERTIAVSEDGYFEFDVRGDWFAFRLEGEAAPTIVMDRVEL